MPGLCACPVGQVIPRHMEWTGAACWLHVGLWGCSRTFRPSGLVGACVGGRLMAWGWPGAGPWRLEGVLGEGFQLLQCECSRAWEASVLLGSEAVGREALCPLHLPRRPTALPSPLHSSPNSKQGNSGPFLECSHFNYSVTEQGGRVDSLHGTTPPTQAELTLATRPE